MIITDALNGHTVEDLRRNQDGSVTLYCDSGRTLTLYVNDLGRIDVKPQKLILPDSLPVEDFPSERMRLLQAFQGYRIDYATYDDHGCITFVCAPLESWNGRESKAIGHREIKLAHSGGMIDELPPVSAKITLEGLSIFGEAM